MPEPSAPFKPKSCLGVSPGDVFVPDHEYRTRRYYVQEVGRKCRTWRGQDKIVVFPCPVVHAWVGTLDETGVPHRDSEGSYMTHTSLFALYPFGDSWWESSGVNGPTRLEKRPPVTLPVGGGLFDKQQTDRLKDRWENPIFDSKSYCFDKGFDPFPGKPHGAYQCAECGIDFNPDMSGVKNRNQVHCPYCEEIIPTRRIIFYPTKGMLRKHHRHRAYPPFYSWIVRREGSSSGPMSCHCRSSRKEVGGR